MSLLKWGRGACAAVGAIGLLVLLGAAAARAQSLNPTGNLQTARAGQTATLLNDGEVLIAGGMDATGHALASAELYDLSSGTFTATGSLQTARTGAAAVLLRSGKVLIVGGDPNASGLTPPGALAPEGTAEIFDPSGGTFAAGPNLPIALERPIAVLLGDGRVWVSGTSQGCKPPNCASPVEIYDPTTNQFTLAGPLQVARGGEAAVLLTSGPDRGDVLAVSGGGANSDAASPISSAEIYDPAKGASVRLVPDNNGFWNASAVVIASGPDAGKVLVTGGSYAGDGPDSWELYTPATRAFAALTGAASAPFFGVLAPLPGGAVLAAGTAAGNGDRSGVYVYNSSLESFSKAGTLDPGRVNFTATTLPDGSVLIAGGNATSADASPGQPLPVLASAVLFAPATSTASDFALAAQANQVVVSTGTTAAFALSVLASGGFGGAVQLSCQPPPSGTESGVTCSFSPPAIAPGVTSTLTVSQLDLTGGPTVPIVVTGISAGSGGGTVATITHTLDLRVDLEPPVAALSPSSLSFGRQNVGTKSPSQTVTLANSGASELQITSIHAEGDFSQSNTCGASIANGAPSCTVTIVFQPTAPGARGGELAISDNAPFAPQTVALNGTGVAPLAALQPTTLNFGKQAVGQAGSAQSITLSNAGNAELTIGAIAVSGDYGQSNTCGDSLGAGKSCTIAIVFTPTTSGARAGTLTLTDNAPGSPPTVALSGAGADPAPPVATATVSLTPPVLSFGAQAGGTSSAARMVTLTNTGSAALVIASIATGTEFTQTNDCGAGLPAGRNCAIQVAFAPGAGASAGAVAGQLTVTDNAGDSPQTVALTGTTTGGPGGGSGSGGSGAPGASSVAIAPSPGASALASVSPGQSANYDLTLTGANNFTGNVTLACTGAPTGATCAPTPVSVAIGSGPAPITVTVTTTGPVSSAARRFLLGRSRWSLDGGLRWPATDARSAQGVSKLPRNELLPVLPPAPAAPFAPRWPLGLWLGMGMAGALLLRWADAGRRRRPRVSGRSRFAFGALVVLGLALALGACGGGTSAPPNSSSGAGVGSNPPPAATPGGTYTLTVTAASNGANVGSTQLTLAVQ